MSGPSATRPLRVAIVGLGPKGLFAFERLVNHARELPTGSIDLTIYEPAPAPGAGPVYDPAQPDYLRMNFAAELVNMWPEGLGPSFSEWRRKAGGLGDEAYPPRGQVGRYLADGFERLTAEAPDSMSVDLRAERVDAVTSQAGCWLVTAETAGEHDEVLVATGHEDEWDGALTALRPSSDGPQTRVFPVERELSRERVPPGSRVAVRGFALTMIDAALALTEGRGGTFHEGREPFLMRYESGADEVALIAPWSRTGRPMLAKPDPRHAIRSPAIDAAAASGREAILALPAGSGLDAVIGLHARAAAKSLHSVAPRADQTAEDLSALLEASACGEPLPADLSPAAEIERSLAVASGAAVPGPTWALGHTWRALYPAIVERLGEDGLDAREWPAFLLLAREMERLAFGPPPVNAAKLLALIEAGRIDLSNASTGPSPDADVIVDAVLPPPGAANIRQPVLESILSGAHARIPPGRRGIEITRDVECVGADGSPTGGLGVIGRPTEDWIIGNDTLNRDLHPQADRWARRVAGRAAA